MPSQTADIFTATNSLKILSFLCENPGREFLGSEIQKGTSLSRAGVYVGLRELIKRGLAAKVSKGKFFMYAAVHDDAVLRQFKVLRNTLLLKTVVSKLKSSSRKIILFGSAGRGEDDAKSDLDVFILSKNPSEARGGLLKIKIKRKIQAVVKSAAELADFQKEEKIFWNEVQKGIVLWEEKE